jgi:hypothetical protein
MRLQKGHKYLVSWFDITTNNDWMTLEDILIEVDQLTPTKNTWTFLKSHKGWLIFSSGQNSDSQHFDYIAIPKTVITKIKELK